MSKVSPEMTEMKSLARPRSVMSLLPAAIHTALSVMCHPLTGPVASSIRVRTVAVVPA
jgi:hypothetical protein